MAEESEGNGAPVVAEKDAAAAKARAPHFASFRGFLESAPLYTWTRDNLPQSVEALRVPVVDQYCPRCRSDRPFRLPGTSRLDTPQKGPGAAGPAARAQPLTSGFQELSYSCTACESSVFRLWLYVDAEFVPPKLHVPSSYKIRGIRKVGQSPPWAATPEPALRRMIGGHADLYRKGLACEGHGFGIGAYGYYRRIVEDIIDNLLRSVAPLVPSAQRDAYDDALERLAETPVAKDKIALVKDLLPASLRPNNLNPLGVLYRALSEGLHAKTDEECLEWASHLRASLVFLALEVTAQADASAQFTASMQKVLDRYRSADEAPTAETQIAEPSDANANE